MKKLLFLLAPIMLMLGCVQEIEFTELPTEADVSETMPEINTRSLEGAVYNEVVDAWMIPRKKPFSLEYFQTRARASTDAKSIKPTHYALKIYPRNEEEQWRVEMMEDVQVAYIPFDYVQLTQDEAEKVTKTRSAANIFPEKSPYTVTYDYTDVTDGGPTGPQTFQLPILYTIWPVDKLLPEDLEYVVDHEVYQTAGAPVRSPLTRSYLPWDLLYPVHLVTYDDALNKNVPLTNFRMSVYTEFLYGGYTTREGFNATTDHNGMIDIGSLVATYANLVPGSIESPVYFELKYQDPGGRWKITGDNTVPLSVVISKTFLHDQVAPDMIVLSSGSRQENEIYRAVNYFYNVQTNFPKYTIPGGMSIIANNISGGETNGSFDPSFLDINIYNNGHTSSSVIGTTLHEIGHFVHCLNNPINFSYTNTLLSESFSSYVGWHEGESYYKSLGWIKPVGKLGITRAQGRQNWLKTDMPPTGYYSPLFVDLTDDYNQKVPGNLYPQDTITGMPPSEIWNIVTTCSTWTQCRRKLQSYVGTYYTDAEFNAWAADFDRWFSTFN